MTELVDPRYRDLDAWTSIQAVTAVWESQLAAVAAIGAALPAIAKAVDAAALRLEGGRGRLAYAGAGTSARVAVQDGTELPPTFDWPEDRLLFLIAGGPSAVTRSVEGAEDDSDAAEREVRKAGLGPDDVLVGLAASGRTPYTLAALRAARAAHALTIAVSNNPDAPILDAAEHPILVETGPEVIAGSTRMKAGTAQKAVLNMISTQMMVRLGRVHRGLMVDMRPLNDKLRDRAVGMVAQIAGCPPEEARAALDLTGWSIKQAVLVARGLDPAAAEQRLRDAHGRLGDAGTDRRDA
jgi:N-acetylmuramic acid 6-phosphate etherase